MAKRWIQGAISKSGALRRALGTRKGKSIPASKLEKAAKGKGLTARRARLAQTLRKLNKGR